MSISRVKGRVMDINKIEIGRNPPHEVNVIVEVPLGGVPVKYEMDKSSGAMLVNRFLHTAMYYPCNYGFIPHTLSADGDPLDVMVAGRTPVMSGAVLRARPVGILHMEDEAGDDEKIIAVPATDLHPYYAKVEHYTDLSQILLDQIAHFFRHYKDLEEGKWVKIKRWGDAQEAANVIMESVLRASQE